MYIFDVIGRAAGTVGGTDSCPIHQFAVGLLTERVVRPDREKRPRRMRKVSSLHCWWLMALVLAVEVCRAERDACDLDDPTLKKLCRKVESQEKYQEKWVATNFKAEMVIMLNSNLINGR